MHPLRKLREAGAPTPDQVAEILAENVVMHSPVLIKPIVGRELVAITISNSSHSRDNPGKYIYEGKLDDRTTLLRWQGTVEGHKIESLELLTDDENGLLLERNRIQAVSGSAHSALWAGLQGGISMPISTAHSRAYVFESQSEKMQIPIRSRY